MPGASRAPTTAKNCRLLSSAYQLGYRGALLLTDAWILVLAAKIGWTASYELIAGLMGLGMIAVMFARESRSAPVGDAWWTSTRPRRNWASPMRWSLRWLAALVSGVAAVALSGGGPQLLAEALGLGRRWPSPSDCRC